MAGTAHTGVLERMRRFGGIGAAALLFAAAAAYAGSLASAPAQPAARAPKAAVATPRHVAYATFALG